MELVNRTNNGLERYNGMLNEKLNGSHRPSLDHFMVILMEDAKYYMNEFKVMVGSRISQRLEMKYLYLKGFS